MIFIHARDRTLFIYSAAVFALWLCAVWMLINVGPLAVCILMHLVMFECNIQLARWIFTSPNVKRVSAASKKHYAPKSTIRLKNIKNHRNSFSFSIIFAVFPILPFLIKGEQHISTVTIIIGYIVAYFSFNIYLFLRAAQNADAEQLDRIIFVD